MRLKWQVERRAVLEAAQRMAALGLVVGTSGNVSRRVVVDSDERELMAIKPSGIEYDNLNTEDILVTDMDIEPVEGCGVPSSEAMLHAEIYRHRRDVGAVMHTHSAFATAVAVAGLDIPPIIDEMVLTVGGEVKVAEYAFPSSEALAANVREALGGRNAALIRNHGVVGVGADLREALKVCELVEHAARVMVYASMLGGATSLPSDVLEAEMALFEMRRKSLEG
ncbi:MAG: class II aldolase/adducin family protein [Dehalococcoidia bacterium]|nr:class II aldolase/adducin family protein [Dehalococcoidia bacterium]